ncbi:MAG: SDR family NAD(P)-dependent oxidoreductase [Thermoleophilia bacterium]|nr:SDR family NAD(P)-dependent oxidoreductase [Thermoleophilia bacterium]
MPDTVYDLRGKVVLVTGGARGIGLAIANSAAARGAKIALIDLNEDVAAETATTINGDAMGYGADVSDRAQLEAAFAQAIEHFGRIDVVVANAGIAPQVTTAHGIAADDWERVVQVNLFGVWHTVRAGMPEVVANGGQFVLVSSSYAFMNGAMNSSYATAKAGVEALGRSLRAELMPLGASATVCYFGWITTEMVTGAFSDPIVTRMRELAPRFLTRQIPVAKAGEAVVEGIEGRAPRVIVPAEYAVFFYLRGLLGPLMDRHFEKDDRVAGIVRDAEKLTLERRGK